MRLAPHHKPVYVVSLSFVDLELPSEKFMFAAASASWEFAQSNARSSKLFSQYLCPAAAAELLNGADSDFMSECDYFSSSSVSIICTMPSGRKNLALLYPER